MRMSRRHSLYLHWSMSCECTVQLSYSGARAGEHSQLRRVMCKYQSLPDGLGTTGMKQSRCAEVDELFVCPPPAHFATWDTCTVIS